MFFLHFIPKKKQFFKTSKSNPSYEYFETYGANSDHSWFILAKIHLPNPLDNQAIFVVDKLVSMFTKKPPTIPAFSKLKGPKNSMQLK